MLLLLSPHSHRGQAKRSILLVDNDRLTREAIEDLLALFGLQVISTGNGGEAVDLFRARHHQIEAVILSARLREGGSQEVLDRLRAIKPQVSVILSSSYSPQEARELFAGRNWSIYLQKPFTSEELLDSLSKVLERPLRSDENP
jgi:two-component system, cell cycle sensor histidine kinase and response regulator CckA